MSDLVVRPKREADIPRAAFPPAILAILYLAAALVLLWLERVATGSDALSIVPDCATLPARGQQIGEQGGRLARRRYQKGRIFLRGKKNPVWVGRWREDVIDNGNIRRIERSEVLGSKSDFPTKRLAFSRVGKGELSVVNDPRYTGARPTAKFADLASRWESLVLTQHKPSTQATIRSHIHKHLVPFFGNWQMREIRTGGDSTVYLFD